MSSAATATSAATTAGSGAGEGAEEAAKDSADIAAFFRSEMAFSNLVFLLKPLQTTCHLLTPPSSYLVPVASWRGELEAQKCELKDHSKEEDHISETFLDTKIVLGLQGVGELKEGRRWLLKYEYEMKGLVLHVAEQLLQLCFLLRQGTEVTCQHYPNEGPGQNHDLYVNF
ncbi:hypothetical protein BTVI_152825 [Pitangus sulphuratus]|nr:hypothetical protein BTVI_152825 [Pitangus sulphuratus]